MDGKRLRVHEKPFSVHFTFRGDAYQYDKINNGIYLVGEKIATWPGTSEELIELAESCVDYVEFVEKLREAEKE